MKVYLDNNATTPLAEEVRKEMDEVQDSFGNPSSLHQFGVTARNIIDTARSRVSSALGCEVNEVVFTSGGTESDNLAIQGFLKSSKKKHIITSKVEHHAVLNLFKYLEKNGYTVSWIDVDEYGCIDPQEVVAELKDDTALVSIMMANNETGTIYPLKDITGKVKDFSSDIIVHTDAVQAFGKMALDVKDIGVDMMSVSAHKINGPKGMGALYIKKRTKVTQLVFGGHHEKGIRPGTENVAGIAGLGKAAEMAVKDMDKKNGKLLELKNKLKKGIESNIKNVKVNGHPERCLANTLNISFENVEGESIIMMLDMEGVGVSTGSACTSGTLESSHVLGAMGVDPVMSQGSIRFSLGKYNTEQEIDYVIEKLPPVIERLRKMSPLERG
ncbi:cysteine desulfurase family protein [Elusimicrobiota bacterium]